MRPYSVWHGAELQPHGSAGLLGCHWKMGHSTGKRCACHVMLLADVKTAHASRDMCCPPRRILAMGMADHAETWRKARSRFEICAL